MLVYGDHVRRVAPGALAGQVLDQLAAVATRGDGIGRHAGLVEAFIAAGELAQGLADAAGPARCPAAERALAAAVGLGDAIGRSWHSGFAADSRDPASLAYSAVLVADAAELASYDELVIKRGEGYAFYALYPEAYWVTARRVALAEPRDRVVIGIRSIGAGLAAIVAAAMEARPPITVRPSGHPFRRVVRPCEAIDAVWPRDPAVGFAVVDEGPGMSGSSFGAVCDLLASRGVAEERVECFPSHAGALGPAASDRDRKRWARIARYPASSASVVGDPERGIARWIAEVIGPLAAPLEDISGGVWRERRYRNTDDWPPAVVHQERLKFVAHAASGSYLARFVGLGREATSILARARTLHADRFVPEPIGIAHGFLIERWIDGASLDATFDRRVLVEHAGRYLAARARLEPPCSGASPQELLAMALHNARARLGDGVTAAFARWDPAELHTRPCAVDGKLQAWEWLVADGQLVKTDAHDHHAAHDLIGCQDIAWDLAGAEIELELDAAEARQIVAVTARLLHREIDRRLVAFYRACYLAFQIGRAMLAAAASNAEEAARLNDSAEAYSVRLRRELFDQSAEGCVVAREAW